MTNRAEIDRLAFVSRARVTQIMDLLTLTPDIQKALLFQPRVTKGPDPVTERELRAVVAAVDWGRQRGIFVQVSSKSHSDLGHHSSIRFPPIGLAD